MTFDTVGTETPAAPATSAIVTRPLPFSGRGTVEKTTRGFGQLSRFFEVEHRWLDLALDREGTPVLACVSENEEDHDAKVSATAATCGRGGDRRRRGQSRGAARGRARRLDEHGELHHRLSGHREPDAGLRGGGAGARALGALLRSPA